MQKPKRLTKPNDTAANPRATGCHRLAAPVLHQRRLGIAGVQHKSDFPAPRPRDIRFVSMVCGIVVRGLGHQFLVLALVLVGGGILGFINGVGWRENDSCAVRQGIMPGFTWFCRSRPTSGLAYSTRSLTPGLRPEDWIQGRRKATISAGW